MKICPKHGNPVGPIGRCKTCVRDRAAGRPQVFVTVEATSSEAVVRKNLMSLKAMSTPGIDMQRHENMAAADKKNEVSQRSRKIYAELNRAKTRKRFGLSRRDIADLLKNPSLSEGLRTHEVKWLRDLGYKNLNPDNLAKHLGVDNAGLELILDPLEALVVGNARARGIAIHHVPDEGDVQADFDKTQAADNADAEIDFAGSVGTITDDQGPDY
jgi:hypothetical protein